MNELNYLPSQFTDAIILISQKLAAHSIEWHLIGKASLTLQGMNFPLTKMGVLVREADFNKACLAFSEFKHDAPFLTENKQAREINIYLPKIRLQICGEYDHGIYWKHLDSVSTNSIGEVGIKLFSVEAEQEVYSQLGLLETSQIIKDFLNNR